MTKNYLLTLSYDGSAYHGWQRQKGVVTVQQTVEDCLAALANAPVACTASGRTDEGVHALGQAVSFACETSVPTEKLCDALNARLPDDIRAVSCRETGENFCARRSAKKKTYVYRMYLSPVPLPHMEKYALRVDAPLDMPLWQEACRAVCGTHDFRAFCCAGSNAQTTVRTIYACDCIAYPAAGLNAPVYEFSVCGNGFLYKTVRLIVGALLRLNDGKISMRDFCAALDGDTTAVKKIPAPGKGLYLKSVEYEQ